MVQWKRYHPNAHFTNEETKFSKPNNLATIPYIEIDNSWTQIEVFPLCWCWLYYYGMSEVDYPVYFSFIDEETYLKKMSDLSKATFLGIGENARI